jgi:hypothetical protein
MILEVYKLNKIKFVAMVACLGVSAESFSDTNIDRRHRYSESTSLSLSESSSVSRSSSSSSTSSSSNSSASTGDSVSSSNVGDVNVSHNTRVDPAPDVNVVPPSATMECIRGFGFGGSNQNGAIVFGPQWKDGDCMANHQFEQLIGLGLYEQAATAYCARNRFAAPFGTKEICRDTVVKALRNYDSE